MKLKVKLFGAVSDISVLLDRLPQQSNIAENIQESASELAKLSLLAIRQRSDEDRAALQTQHAEKEVLQREMIAAGAREREITCALSSLQKLYEKEHTAWEVERERLSKRVQLLEARESLRDADAATAAAGGSGGVCAELRQLLGIYLEERDDVINAVNVLTKGGFTSVKKFKGLDDDDFVYLESNGLRRAVSKVVMAFVV